MNTAAATSREGALPARGHGAQLGLVRLVAGVTAAALFHALDLASRLAQTSDSAQSLVAGHAVVRGNMLLSGWHLPLNDYYFTDTLPYAALEWLVGPRPFLLVLVPALTYALFVLALEGDRISAITWFADSSVFPQFGLPRSVRSSPTRPAHPARRSLSGSDPD